MQIKIEKCGIFLRQYFILLHLSELFALNKENLGKLSVFFVTCIIHNEPKRDPDFALIICFLKWILLLPLDDIYVFCIRNKIIVLIIFFLCNYDIKYMYIVYCGNLVTKGRRLFNYSVYLKWIINHRKCKYRIIIHTKSNRCYLSSLNVYI